MPETAAAINEQIPEVVKALERVVDALLVANGELEEIRKLLAKGNEQRAKRTAARDQ